jgi:flagellar hook-associated protein 3 FlgL
MLDAIDSSSQAFLLAMDQLNKRLDRAQQQVSSGKRIQTASDSPDQITELLSVRAEIAQNQQVRTDLASYRLEADVAAHAITQASTVLDNVKSLTSIALDGTLDPTMQANLAQEVQGYMQDMVGIAGTQANGRYVFSGDNDQVAPFSLDLTKANGVTAYAGTASSRRAQAPDGSSFAIAKDGQDIFDSPIPGADVFGALNNLRLAIWSNNSSAVQAALTGIQTAQDHLQTEAVFYGIAQSRISQATDDAANKDQQLQSQRSSIEDADITSSILELQQVEFQRQAALTARAKTPPTSLFDYLKG